LLQSDATRITKEKPGRREQLFVLPILHVPLQSRTERMHQKIDHLRETEVLLLIDTIHEMQAELRALHGQPSVG